MAASDPTPTAAVLVIGDEILSGRTKDRNSGTIADVLNAAGIDLREIRTVADEEDDVVAALNALRARYAYVFTTGGIGPTHDDITADAVARAFGVPITEDPRAIAIMLERYKREDLNEARRRMARIPEGADLVPNTVSKAPGFHIGNVFVMAGVPSVMQAMLDAIMPMLATGQKMHATTIEADGLPEGVYAAPLAAIAKAHSGAVAIGSYPSFQNGAFRNRIVVRSRDAAKLETVAAEVAAMVASLRPTERPA